MQVTAVKTPLLKAGDNLEEIIASALPRLPERSVVVIASKAFSTVENRFVPKTTEEKSEKHNLVRQEAEYYIEPHSSKYNLMLTIKRNAIFVNAGIDESNADDQFILWPEDPQRSLNTLWLFLREWFGVKELGLTMSDSTSFPLNWGVVGHAIAYCGFNPLKSYIGKPDLFGRPMKMEQVNVAQSLTAAAVWEMGEGDERQPLALIEGLPAVEFLDHVPTDEELAALKIEMADDAYAPILSSVEWKKSGTKPTDT